MYFPAIYLIQFPVGQNPEQYVTYKKPGDKNAYHQNQRDADYHCGYIRLNEFRSGK